MRVNKLIDAHKARLDQGVFALRTAVALSYLSPAEQEFVDEVLKSGTRKISMAEAEELHHAKRPLTHKIIEDIIRDPSSNGARGFRLEPDLISRYFTKDQSREEIAEVNHTGTRPLV